MIPAKIEMNDNELVRTGINISESFLKTAEEIVINQQEGFLNSFEIIKTIKTRYAELEEKRKELTKPLDAVKKQLMDLFKTPLETLNKAETILREKCKAYELEQEKIRKENELRIRIMIEKEKEKIEEQIEKAKEKGNFAKVDYLTEKANNLIAPVFVSNVDKVTGVSNLIDYWYARVIDFKALPDEYKLADHRKLDAIAKATKGTQPIAGVVYYKESGYRIVK